VSLARSEVLPVALGDDWQAVFRRGERVVAVRAGAFGDVPAELLGLARSGEAWFCTSLDAQRRVEQALAGHELGDLTQVYDDPRCGPRTFRFSFARLPGLDAVAVRCREVTARRAHVRALHLHAQILDAMGEGVLLVEDDGTIALANPAAAAMLGRAPGALSGHPVETLGAPFAEFVRGAAPAGVGDGEAATPFDLPRPDEATVAVSASVRDVPDGRRLVVLRDVTERRRLERELLDTERRERERLARDLHDGVGQELTAISLLLKGLGASLRKTQPAASEEIERIVQLVNGAIGGTRSMARGLFEASLPAGGLVGALAGLERPADGVAPPVTLATRLDEPLQLDRRSVVELYRIAQEATTNALRHSGALCVRIELASTPAAVRLTIDDDGSGLSADTSARGGMGLHIMRYRAHVLGTELAIGPGPAGGTRVQCVLRRVPLSSP
jgi:signal transduction histidine kinase